MEAGERLYRESDADIAAACRRRARIDARHLRAFRTAAARQSALVEQLVAPALRSRNPERRRAGPSSRRSPWRPRSCRSCCFCATCDSWRSGDGGRRSGEDPDVPDFPTEGIVFKDITPLVADPVTFRETIDRLAAWAGERQPDIILGAEARGFIFGGALAYARLRVRACSKARKLPWETVKASYELEYGWDSLEIHRDAIGGGARVIVLDDVLATGGTARAKVELVEQLGGVVVGALFLIELTFLTGREKLAGYDVHALIAY